LKICLSTLMSSSAAALKVSLLLNAVLVGLLVVLLPQQPAGTQCAPCPAPTAANCEGGPSAASNAVVLSSRIPPPPEIGEDPERPREDGWVGSIKRVAKKTPRTSYDPQNDEAYASGVYSMLTPNPSMTIEVRKGRTVTMDDAIYAYDIWFEEHHIFDRLSWMGVSMQQDPADAIAIQQMLFHVKPDLVIEIGTNTGGGAVFYSSIMRMYNPKAKVVTVDPRPVSNWRDGAKSGANLTYCDRCILANEHPYWSDGGIEFIQGRITGHKCEVMDKLQKHVDAAKRVLVIEDAGHQAQTVALHVETLHKFVSVNSYMLVQDTKLTRLWGPGKKGKQQGPVPSVKTFIETHDNFVVDRRYEYLMYSQHHWGWLRKTREQ
jgi:cephalosporin hydroxylase